MFRIGAHPNPGREHPDQHGDRPHLESKHSALPLHHKPGQGRARGTPGSVGEAAVKGLPLALVPFTEMGVDVVDGSGVQCGVGGRMEKLGPQGVSRESRRTRQ